MQVIHNIGVYDEFLIIAVDQILSVIGTVCAAAAEIVIYDDTVSELGRE